MMRYFFLWGSISSLLGGRLFLGSCLLWFWMVRRTGVHFFLQHFRWLRTACSLRCCLGCLTRWKECQIKRVAHYLECIICCSLPQLIFVSMFHLTADFHFVDVSWMIMITIQVSGENCIFFRKFPSSTVYRFYRNTTNMYFSFRINLLPIFE